MPQLYRDLKNFSRARDRRKNFGFVTFCRRSSAASAIENVDRAGPLFLKVRFKMEEEEKVEREEMKCEAANFGTKWDLQEFGKGPEKDFDEQIAEEERMLDEVDRFFKDESSEEWMEMVTQPEKEVLTESKEEKDAFKPTGPSCARCSRTETSNKCSGCKDVHYCSVVCQRLDWAKHKATCREKMQQNTDQSCQSKPGGNLEENFVGKSNGHEVGHLPTSSVREEGKSGWGGEAGFCYGESRYAVANTAALPRSPTSGQTGRSETQLASSVPSSTARVVSSATSPQAARSSVSLLQNGNNAEGSLAASSGSASTGYFLQLEDDQEESSKNVNSDEMQESLKERRYLRGEADSEEESVEEEIEVMTSMADAMNAPVDIQPFSLEVDAHCTVELLSYDQESRVAKIMSVEEGVAEALESLLKECAASRGLEENPPKVGQLVAILGPTGAYIRAKITGLNVSSKQVRIILELSTTSRISQVSCDPLDIGGGALTRHLKFVHKLPDTEVVPRLVQQVHLLPSSFACLGQNCIGQRFLARLLQGTHHGALPLVELVQVPVEGANHVDKVLEEEVRSCSSSSYSLASCLSLHVGRVQEVTVTHVESPREVYLCPDQRELERLQTHLFSTGQSLAFDPNFCPTVNSMVLACSPDDHYWYRALVEKVQPGGALVFCPDFGFRTSVAVQQIRAINKKLAFARQKFLSARYIQQL